MLRKSILLGAAALLVLAGAAPAATTSETVPFNFAVVVPCAADGAGELLLGTGRLHIVSGFTADNAGGTHFHLSFQPQGLKAVGQTTGDVYQANGGTRFKTNINAGGLPITDTFVNNFRMIAPGPGNNLQVHETFHITINENGVVTAFVAQTRITCD